MTTQDTLCPRCDGWGHTSIWRGIVYKCRHCEGTGRVPVVAGWRPHEPERRNVLDEMLESLAATPDAVEPAELTREVVEALCESAPCDCWTVPDRHLDPDGHLPQCPESTYQNAVEDQYTISRWADDTFGPVGSNLSVAQRARKEFDELYRALEENDWHPKAAEEVADVVIILYRLADRLGVDLHAEIDRKMAVNRKRTWLLDGEGHGQHVVEETEDAP